MRTRLARAIVQRAAYRVPVRLNFPDGSSVGGGSAADPAVELVRPQALFGRIARHPKIGLGEGYMAGDWRVAEGSDLAAFLLPFAARITEILPPWMMALRGVVDRRIPHVQRNTLGGSRRNIAAHYDLSNGLFAAFLDETLSYSSALFRHDQPIAQQPLADAQRRKIEAALDAAGVADGTRLLEIGTGWGSLAIAAAERGAQVTTITLSAEQRALAIERIAAAGQSERVDVLLKDYREVRGEYDAIVSIEMIEAVGDEFWPTYFQTLDARLAPGGRICVQAILMDHDRYLATRNSFGWIQKYIFPGGMIPTVTAIRGVIAEGTDLKLVSAHHFGASYAETLRRWRAEFNRQWPGIQQLGFDETFRRMWEYYLAYCEAGFASGYLDVAQLVLAGRHELAGAGAHAGDRVRAAA